MAAMPPVPTCISVWTTTTLGLVTMVAGARATGLGRRGGSCLDPISMAVAHHTERDTGRRRVPIRFRRFLRDRILAVRVHAGDQGLGDSLLCSRSAGNLIFPFHGLVHSPLFAIRSTGLGNSLLHRLLSIGMFKNSKSKS